MDCKFDELLGKTLIRVEKVENDQLVFTTDTGEEYCQYHQQECSEDVTIEDIIGDLDDLIGSPILLAEEVSNAGYPDDDDDHYTWTFYKLATNKGYVTIRWYGSSNGYYSETVDFKKITLDEKPHRTDVPVESADDYKERWYINGKLHRTDGPAVVV